MVFVSVVKAVKDFLREQYGKIYRMPVEKRRTVLLIKDRGTGKYISQSVYFYLSFLIALSLYSIGTSFFCHHPKKIDIL